jgi:acetyltransferase-like isoleucine patch superfamily enzyme
MNTNQIDETAKIHPNVILGNFNRIGKNVVIDIIGENLNIYASIGDNNIINDNTRILIYGVLKIGDWNVFHNDMLIMAEDTLTIGHNCWFGQNTILDGAGGLEIGNGVRVGMYSQVWTHIASGEQIEGCVFYSKRKSIIKDNVWLVGSCVVGSGVVLGERSTILINSVVTKDTLPDKAYSGSPAKIMENLKVYLPKTLDEKHDMLKNWLEEFVSLNAQDYKLKVSKNELTLENINNNNFVIFTKSKVKLTDNSISIFYLTDKTFNKTNTLTERTIYRFLYANKARFLPV